MIILILSFFLASCFAQTQIRIEIISNPNRFDFSLIAIDTSNNSVLLAGSDYVIRVGHEFQQSSLINVPNLPSRVSLAQYDHFNDRFFVCNRNRQCHFYNTSDLSETIAISELFIGQDNIPNSALFAMMANSQAVYVYGSFIGSTVTTRYSLQGYQLNNLAAAPATFTGQPRDPRPIRTLINEFVYGDRIFYLVRHIDSSVPFTRLFTLCDNTGVTSNRFISILEFQLAPCDSLYQYLVSGRVLQLNDGNTHLVLIYRAGDSNTPSILCSVNLNDVITNIAANYNVISETDALQWPTASETGANVISSGVFSSITLCDFNLGGGNIFALMTPQPSYATSPFLPDAYRADPNTFGRLSILFVYSVDTFFYLLLFTEEGYMLKYYINGSSLTADVTLLEGRFVSNTFRDRVSSLVPIGTDYILALTPRELLRVPVSDCERHDTCLECVTDRDPLCGWCSVQNACTQQSSCYNSNLTYRWIDSDNLTCPEVLSVSPNISNININTTVTISAANLPQLAPNNTYLCVFSLLGTTEVSAVSGGHALIGPAPGYVNLTCQIPASVASFNESESRIVSFSLSTTESPSGIDSEIPFQFFDCGYHSSCEDCIVTTDNSPCRWCVYSGVCAYSSVLCPDLDLPVDYQWIDSECPFIQSIDPSTSSLVAEIDNTIRIIYINGLPVNQSSFQYECRLSYDDTVYLTPAVFSPGYYLSCSIPADSLPVTNSNIIPVQIQVVFASRIIYNDVIQLYSCVLQGSTCAQCLSSRQTRTRCGWCESAEVCSTDSCDDMFLTNSCPNPDITSVSPTVISVHYTDQLSIRGSGLGIVSDQLFVTVVISDSSSALLCSSIKVDTQNIGREVNCTLTGLLLSPLRSPGASANTTLTLSITNTLGDTLTATHSPLHIISPLIQGLDPSFGPVAGGTLVKVSGVGLGVGTTRSAEIIGVGQCVIVSQPSYSNGVLECITDPIVGSKAGQFRVTIDGTNYDSNTGLFAFRENPQILSVTPTGVISSGTSVVTFQGISLDAAADPIIRFYSGRDLGVWPCTIISTSELTCPFPAATTAKRQTAGDAVNFTLEFDGYTDSLPNINIIVLPDPTFLQTTFLFSENFHITVSSINRTVELQFETIVDYSSAQLSDLFTIEVLYEDDVFDINNTVTYLLDRLSVELFNIRVDAIQTSTYKIYVLLEDYRTPAGEFVVISGVESLKETGSIVIGGALGILILIIALVLVLVCIMCCLRKRGSIAQAEVEKLIFEMDTIENRVAQACRTEFAELNTELGEASDLTQGAHVAIPFLSFHRFVMNIMFPGEPDHPVMHPVRIPPDIDDKEFLRALELFDELLRDKEYFLSLVNCIESNRSFSLRDRANIASLFALCMHEDISYLTVVLRTLLEDLSERMVAQSRAKLMFRRTESVAEKLLSDWLALLMYNYLIEGAGPAIHYAYRATKRQTEKGPVDVFTGEAKHSLAKEKILAQFIDIEEMRELEAEVIISENNSIKVKLLECDTISQAKLKIMDAVYCGQPVSQRPHVTELDLELHSTRKQGAGLILRDNDHTSIVQGDWKRVNTLSHYAAITQVFKLVPRTQKVHGGQVYDYLGTLIMDNSIHSVRHRNNQDDDKIWHLSKPQDQTLATAKSKKLATEIYLMRLISTKNILQKYVDDMVCAIFPDVTLEPHKLAPPIKFLFDLLEQLAEQYDIDDKDNVIRLWKNNSVPLKFWVSLIRNPDYLFDILKSETIDSNLTVISQVFIDSCLATDSQITEDAQTTKILYNKEVPVYRERILNYYDTVSRSPAVSEERLFESYAVPKGGDHFYRESALQSLYSYAHSCKDKLVEEMLDDGRFDQQVAKFEEICDLLSRHSKT